MFTVSAPPPRPTLLCDGLRSYPPAPLPLEEVAMMMVMVVGKMVFIMMVGVRAVVVTYSGVNHREGDACFLLVFVCFHICVCSLLVSV